MLATGNDAGNTKTQTMLQEGALTNQARAVMVNNATCWDVKWWTLKQGRADTFSRSS